MKSAKAKRTVAFATLIWAVAGLGQGASAPATNQNITSSPASVYDPDPSHIWNRLFAVFYHRKVSSYVNQKRDKTMARWIGPDVLDPPIGYHPRFVLEDEPFAKCDEALDEFLGRQGAELIRDPLKRAVFQRDLWAVFDVLATTNHSPITRSSAESSPASATASHERHRIILQRKLARAIRSLALSQAEIQSLPDTYAAAVRSGAFSDDPSSNNYDVLPHDLFATNGAWFEIQLNGQLPQHTLLVNGRSVFRAFFKSPAGTTNVLEDHFREIEDWRWRYSTWLTNSMAGEKAKPAPERPANTLPAGTQLLLLREMICLDKDLQMVPTPVVESVQFRITQKKWTSERLIAREAILSRTLLFQGKRGGLRSVSTDEQSIFGYEDLGLLRVDDKGNCAPCVAFPQNCVSCHSTRLLWSQAQASSKPARSPSIESISRWKEKNGSLDQLRRLILSPTDDGASSRRISQPQSGWAAPR